ncbi:hypothetical protein B0T22DRAFT_6393 [Podospora appendiculata]|uniref:Uncharacterized protein n=1 Tax=Podospora appendiculata TaxID=314037 RepID=A0AAE1CF20_9PEZI|nr:hypothetical protein B0T22DRAFT_6393 [Podospora appendiculata]
MHRDEITRATTPHHTPPLHTGLEKKNIANWQVEEAGCQSLSQTATSNNFEPSQPTHAHFQRGRGMSFLLSSCAVRCETDKDKGVSFPTGSELAGSVVGWSGRRRPPFSFSFLPVFSVRLLHHHHHQSKSSLWAANQNPDMTCMRWLVLEEPRKLHYHYHCTSRGEFQFVIEYWPLYRRSRQAGNRFRLVLPAGSACPVGRDVSLGWNRQAWSSINGGSFGQNVVIQDRA